MLDLELTLIRILVDFYVMGTQGVRVSGISYLKSYTL